MERQEKEKRIQQYIRAYQELLAEKGYATKKESDLPEELSMKFALKNAFEMILDNDDGRTQFIQFFAAVWLRSTAEMAQFQFNFEYDPAKVTINLKSLALDTDDHTIVCEPTLNSSFPSAAEVIKLLHDARKIDLLQKLSTNIRKGPRM